MILSKNGFLLVATRTKSYLHSAQMLADSLKEYAPEHSVILFTEERWKNEPGNHIFDKVYFEGVSDSNRSKLFALGFTPFDITCYLDTDMICVHPDAKNVFDLIKEDYDQAWTQIRPYNAAKIWWDRNKDFHPHGGMFLYRKNNRNIKFMQNWWDRWFDLQERSWEVLNTEHNWENMSPWFKKEYCMGWDQWPLGLQLGAITKDSKWYMPEIKWHYIEDRKPKNARWNFIQGYSHNIEGTTEEEVVFRDYSTLLFKQQYYAQLR